MRQNFLRYLVLGADLDRNSINILAEVLALLANLLLFFVVIGCNLVDVYLRTSSGCGLGLEDV